MDENSMRYFVVQTDSHIVEPGQTLYGIDTEYRAKTTVRAISSERVEVECAVHLGDVCDTVIEKDRMLALGSKESYAHAASLFSPITCPTLYIPGNHDDPNLMYEMLGDRWNHRTSGVSEYEFNGTTLIGLDVRTGPEPTAVLSPETEERLRAVLAKSERVMIFCHYPFASNNNPRIADDLRILNFDTLIGLLLEFRTKVLAFFHGHLHLWCSHSINGIPVFGLAGSGFNFLLEPGSAHREIPVPGPLGYYLVGIDRNGIADIRPRYALTA